MRSMVPPQAQEAHLGHALAPGDVMRTLGCFHVFHDRCLVPWLVQRSSCPQCKANVVGLALAAGRYTDGLVHVRI